MRLSSNDLELLRSRPQKSELSLAIFQPQIALKCRINSPSISKGAVTIPYNSVTAGSYLSAEADMTVLIGTTEGGDDVGVVRLRSITSTQMVVAENSDIAWQDSLYITILRFVDIFAVFPRIIQNPTNDEDIIFYKDYNIPHTNQNNILGTLINMGSHRYAEIVDGTGTLYYSATGTTNVQGNSLTYDWAFEGGTPTGSTLHTPCEIRYSQAGDYVTRLRVTASNGAVDTSYRYITVRDKLGQGNYPSLTQWKFNNLQGSRGEGGYSAEVEIYEPVTVRDGSIVIIKSKDYYGNTQRNLGGNFRGGEDIFFVGIVDGSTIRYNYNKSEVSFRVTSATGLMKRTTGFSISVESVSNSNKWYQLKDMTVVKALYHFLRWHTTILKSTDVQFLGTDLPIQFFDADRGSLFDSVDTLLRGRLIGSACADRQGKVWLEVEPKAYNNPTGSFIPVMDITKRDWRGEPNIEELLYDNMSYIEAGGIAYSGAVTGTFDAFLAGAPGSSTPANRGNIESITGLALVSQSQLNQLVGNLWANANPPYPTITIDGAGMLKNIDIAPFESFQITIDAEDTVRQQKIQGLFIPESLSWSYDSLNQFLIANNIEFKQLVSGIPGETITIQTTPEDGYSFPDFEIPNFSVDVNIPELVSYDPIFLNNVQMSIKDKGIVFTNDLSSDNPTWYPMNGGLPDVANTIYFETANTGRMFCQYGLQSIYTASQPGDVWTLLFNADDSDPYNPLLDNVGDPLALAFPRGRRVDGFAINRHAGDDLAVFAGLVYSIFSSVGLFLWRGDSSELTRVGTTEISFDMAGSNRKLFSFYVGDKWLIQYYDGLATSTKSALVSEGGVISNEIAGGLGDDSIMTQSYMSNDVVLRLHSGTVTTDGGLTWTPLPNMPSPYYQGGGTNRDEFQSAITNADGSVIVVGTSVSSNIHGLVYSINGGSSFVTGTAISSFISGTCSVTSVWHIADDSYLVSIVDANGLPSILGIKDLTTTPIVYNKTGNLREVITGTFYPTSIRHYWGI